MLTVVVCIVMVCSCMGQPQDDRDGHNFDLFMCVVIYSFAVTACVMVYFAYLCISCGWKRYRFLTDEAEAESSSPTLTGGATGVETSSSSNEQVVVGRTEHDNASSSDSRAAREDANHDMGGHMPPYHLRSPLVHFIWRTPGEELGPVVYITRSGAFYHALSCRWIQGRQATEVELSNAIQRGFAQCRTCRGGFPVGALQCATPSLNKAELHC